MKPPTFAPVYVSLYPHLAGIANEHGYALAAHGSLVSDMDLVAIPWAPHVSEPADLMRSMADYLHTFSGAFGLELNGPTEKPHRRVSWKLQTGFGSAVDLSVIRPE